MSEGQTTILLIDDDQDDYVLTRSLLSSNVEGKRFMVKWVATYDAALEIVGRKKYDVYLIDYRLGQHNGIELLRAILAQGCTAPAILLTGVGDRGVDVEAMQAGAADYLAKDQLSAELLERSIRYAIAHKQAEAALRQARDELEVRVHERTSELVEANNTLRAEMAARQQAETALRDKERLAVVGTTAAKLAHEIGNPLNGMSTSIQMLERYLTKRPEATDNIFVSNLHDIKNEINRLFTLLQELRTLARPQQLNLQPTSLAAITADVLETHAQYYRECGIHINCTVPAELPLVRADGEKLRRVLLNLCKNAVEAMPGGGTLTVRGACSNTGVSLEVIDTGMGIAEEINIFEPFASTKAAGTGLGLAIVQQIVVAHGGTITYKSMPGQGATFTLLFPITSAETEQKHRPEMSKHDLSQNPARSENGS
jgi:signal transduction histidine kinase